MNKLPVHLSLEKDEDGKGYVGVAIDVENVTDEAISNVVLEWHCRHTTAQFGEVGEGPLGPGEIRRYIFQPEWLADLLSSADVLSSDEYYISIRLDGESYKAIDGRTFGGWVEKAFRLT